MENQTESLDADDQFLARDSPDLPHALIAFDSAHDPHMRRLARLVAMRLEDEGFIADLADASAHAMPVPPDYELVIVGMTLHRLNDYLILRWLEYFSSTLHDVPSAAFVVASNTHWPHALSRISHHLDWHPLMVTAFPPLAVLSSHRFARQLVADQRSVSSFVHRVVARLRHASGGDLATTNAR
jgi:menaquinone-dependent protoporphyrinogen IX oxidase